MTNPADPNPVPLAPGPEVLDAPTGPKESRKIRFVIAALGAGLLFAPWAAYVTGARSDPVPGENRALAVKPTYDGFKTLSALTQYAADRFPLRDVAIRDNKRLITDVFGENPSYAGEATKPPVFKGKNGWLYLTDDYDEACAPKIQLDEVVAGVKRLNAMLAAAGKRLVLAVPPDKSEADPENLPPNFNAKECGAKAYAARKQALADLGIPGYVDLNGAIAAQEKATGSLAYLPYDTHWNSFSETTFAQAVAKVLDPALATGTSVVKSTVPISQQGDLEVLNGNGAKFPDQGYDLVRNGVTTITKSCDEYGAKIDSEAYDVNHYTSTATGTAKLFQPRTVWIGDSFTQRALPKIWPYFSNMTRVPELTKAILAGNDSTGALVYRAAVPRMLYEISHSNVVVVELVDRTFAGTGGFGTLWSTDFLDQVQAALTNPPTSYPTAGILRCSSMDKVPTSVK